MTRLINATALKQMIKDLHLIVSEDEVLRAIDKAPTLSSYDEAIRIIEETGEIFEAIRELTDIAEAQLVLERSKNGTINPN